MACGCQRGKQNKKPKGKKSTLSVYRIRKSKCNSCKYAKRYPYIRNPKIKLLTSKSKCKKSNKFIASVLKNIKYKCPIGRF